MVPRDRGSGVVRLSEFQDACAELMQADQAGFAHWLTELLVDACLEPGPSH